MLYQISRPWAYITIKGRDKQFYDLMLPAIFSLAATIIAITSKGAINHFGPGGIISGFTSFIQNLPGFFIAALSVVATFQKAEMDYLLAQPTPTIEIRSDGRNGPIRLTRRRFLGLLFSFLTAQSIAITVIGIFLTSYSGHVAQTIAESAKIYLFAATLFIYLFLVFQMITITLWGLYYLSERMLQGETPEKNNDQ